MLSTQYAVEAQRGLYLPVGCQWQFHHPLKERIMLLKRPIPSTARRVAATTCVLAVVAGASLTAWAAQADLKPAAKHAIDVAPIVNTLPSENVTYRRMQPPVYPESAIKARQSGRVILKVQVDDEGHAKSAEVDMAEPPEARGIFGESAVAAALKWTFNPGIKDGKPQGGWVLVPIDFAIDDEGGPTDKSNLRG
jgi:TonB family protein